MAHPENPSADLCLFPFWTAGRPELYYIHEVSGSVLNFAAVARELGERRDVIGIQSLGLDPDCAADQTVEEMAERYVGILLDRDAPPFDIVGYSMGGLIAFEMASLLRRRGAAVRLLGLLDPPVPGSLASIGPARMVKMIAHSIGIHSVATADDDDADRLLAQLVAQGRSAGVLPVSYTIDDLRLSLDLRLVNAKAASRYRPAAVIQSDIRLLCAEKGRLAATIDGWAPLTEGRVLGEAVEADHYTLMTEGNAAVVARVIERWLPER